MAGNVEGKTNYLTLMLTLPSSTITPYTPVVFEPIVHPRAEEAKKKGMTVELLLEVERKLDLGNGVVFLDTGSDANNYHKAIAGNDPEINARELSRRTEGEEKAKQETAKAVDAILGMTMPSTYINTALEWSGKERMPSEVSTMVDFAVPIAGGFGSTVFKSVKQMLPRISKELSLRRFARNLNTNISKASSKTILEYIQDEQGRRLTGILSDPNNLIHYDHDLSILGKSRTNPLRRLSSYIDRQFLKPGLPMYDSDKPWIWAELGHPYGGEYYTFERTHLNPNKQKRIIVTTSDALPVFTPESLGMRQTSADSRLLPYINLTDENVKLYQTNPITGLYDEIKFLGPNLNSQASGKVYPLMDRTQIPTTEEYLSRLKEAVPNRISFMLENPVTFTDPHVSYTSFEDQIKRAGARGRFPMEDLSKIETGVTYTPTSGWEYGNTIGSYWGDKYKGEYGKGIRLYFNSNDKLPINLITKNHEFNHYTGNSPDEYIYQYLKDNNIVDWNHVGRYYKDADAGEIGTHLSELVDFSNGQPITTDLINNYIKYLRYQGFNMQHSIFNNIIDYNKFIDFINNFKFKRGGKMNYIDFFKNGSGIHIKKNNQGKFTASAKAAGESVQEHAHKVMNDPNATTLQKKRANFAIQAKRWARKHQTGGIVKGSKGLKTTTTYFSAVHPEFGNDLSSFSMETRLPRVVGVTPDYMEQYDIPVIETTTPEEEVMTIVAQPETQPAKPAATTTKPANNKFHKDLVDLLELFVKYNVPIKVTSGYREGARTSSGKVSFHATGEAMDIIPTGGHTFLDIANMIKNTPEIANFMKSHKLGVLDETSKEMLARTGGTGAHFHVGRDNIAQRFWS